MVHDDQISPNYILMQTAIWGKIWVGLDAIAFNAPESIPYNKRGTYKSFFVDNLRALLPCIYCRISFIEYSEDLPIEAFYDTRAGLAVWLYKIHALVNKKLSKPDISFFDYVKKVESMRAKCSKTGAKGCTEPHIEKDGHLCHKWSDSAWEQYGNLDIAAWKRQRVMYKLLYWSLWILAVCIIMKYLLRVIIRHRASRLIKLIS